MKTSDNVLAISSRSRTTVTDMNNTLASPLSQNEAECYQNLVEGLYKSQQKILLDSMANSDQDFACRSLLGLTAMFN